jgi:succinoglycan biosynthesis transport protein ExoP
MEVKQIIFMLRRWFWLLVVGFLAGLISGVLVSVLMTPIYQFETKVLVSRNAQSATAEFPNLNDVQLVQTYVELLSTDQIIDQVEANTGFHVDTEKLTIQQLRDTQIISIAVEDTNVERGLTIANGLVDALKEENSRLQAQQYLTAENSLEEQISQAKSEMESLQVEINNILTQDVQEQLAEVDGQIASLENEILDLQNEIARMGNPLATVVQGRLADNQARLTQLQNLLTQYQGIRTNLLFLGKPDTTGSGITNPRLDQLKSTLALYQNIYLNHLTSLENLRLARLQSTPTVTQIEIANIPSNPIRPIPIIYTGLAAIVGLVIAAVGAIVIEFLDDAVKTPEDVQSIKPMPVLGMIRKIPSIKTHFINDQEITEEPLSSIFEDYRSLGVQLEYQRENEKFRTLMVTSSGRGEGKTTAAINLATIYARSGQKVLLLDANLRQPRLHSILGDNSEIRILDLAKLNSTVTKDTKDLLGMSKILSVLKRVEDWGDRMVIIDAPPIFTADAKILASKVDGLVLVVKAWETEKDALQAAIKQLEQVNAKIIGLILNSVPTEYSYYYDKYHFLESDNYFKSFPEKYSRRLNKLIHIFNRSSHMEEFKEESR